jgi:SAF domain-containing protein
MNDGGMPVTPSESSDRRPTAPIPRRITRPSWLDLRLIVGVGLVLVSMISVSWLLTRVDQRQPVWAVKRAVAAGTTLSREHLAVVRVQLAASSDRYVSAAESVIGKTVRHDLSSGELIARADVVTPTEGVVVALPLAAERAPRISAGERITVWLSTKSCRGSVLLSGVPVQDVRASNGALGGAATVGLVLRLSPAEADRVMSVIDIDGASLRAGVLSAAASATAPRDISACSKASQ